MNITFPDYYCDNIQVEWLFEYTSQYHEEYNFHRNADLLACQESEVLIETYILSKIKQCLGEAFSINNLNNTDPNYVDKKSNPFYLAFAAWKYMLDTEEYIWQPCKGEGFAFYDRCGFSNPYYKHPFMNYDLNFYCYDTFHLQDNEKPEHIRHYYKPSIHLKRFIYQFRLIEMFLSILVYADALINAIKNINENSLSFDSHYLDNYLQPKHSLDKNSFIFIIKEKTLGSLYKSLPYDTGASYVLSANKKKCSATIIKTSKTKTLFDYYHKGNAKKHKKLLKNTSGYIQILVPKETLDLDLKKLPLYFYKN